jgi:3'-5' exoribonuclease
MSRRFISQLGEHESIDEIFLAAEKQLRTNRNGNLYLQMRLADRTGTLNAMMWNANDQLYASFDNGDFLRVRGTTQFYNGSLQMIVNHLEREDANKVNEADFLTLTPADIDRLSASLSQMLRGIQDFHLRNLVECFLMDEQFMRRLAAAPAGVKKHHAYRGGLLEHIVSLMEVATAVASCYADLNAELLLVGAFLHDMGKIDELTYERDLAYSDAGQLIGHVVLAVGILDEKIREAERLSGEPFPEALALQLKHMIVSHHGQYEFGSPKLPMTLEAVALHFLDNLDARMHSIGQLIREDANTASNWTPYQADQQRKFFKTLEGINGSHRSRP